MSARSRRRSSKPPRFTLREAPVDHHPTGALFLAGFFGILTGARALRAASCIIMDRTELESDLGVTTV